MTGEDTVELKVGFLKGESPTYFSKVKPTHDLPGV